MSHAVFGELPVCPQPQRPAVRAPVEEERRSREPARRGQYCLTHESRRCPQPLPLLASPLLDRLVAALLPVSGQAGVSGSGICLSLILGIQIPCSDLSPALGPAPLLAPPVTGDVGRTSTRALQPAEVGKGGQELWRERGLGKEERRLNVPQA